MVVENPNQRPLHVRQGAKRARQLLSLAEIRSSDLRKITPHKKQKSGKHYNGLKENINSIATSDWSLHGKLANPSSTVIQMLLVPETFMIESRTRTLIKL